MPTLLARGDDIGFTIVPYHLDQNITDALKENPSDYVLGFVTTDKNTMERTFTYTESSQWITTDNHWSITLLKEFPWIEQDNIWIVYAGYPESAASEFNKILSQYAQTMHLYNWDIWRVEEKKQTIAILTGFDIY